MANSEFDEQRSVLGPDGDRDAQVTEEFDTVFGVISAAQRRYLLYAIDDAADAVLPIEEVVEAVRAYEAAGSETDERPARQPIRMSLVHSHLPRLAAAGVLDYDPRRGEVRFHGNRSLEGWLEQTRALELV